MVWYGTLFFPIPFIAFTLRPSFSLPLLVATQIRGHLAGSSPPSPPRFVPCIFITRIFQLFLPSSTCVELCMVWHGTHDDTGCRRLEITGVSQVSKGEHRRSHVHEPTWGSMMMLYHCCCRCAAAWYAARVLLNPEKVWDGIVQPLFRMARTHKGTVRSSCF